MLSRENAAGIALLTTFLAIKPDGPIMEACDDFSTHHIGPEFPVEKITGEQAKKIGGLYDEFKQICRKPNDEREAALTQWHTDLGTTFEEAGLDHVSPSEGSYSCELKPVRVPWDPIGVSEPYTYQYEPSEPITFTDPDGDGSEWRVSYATSSPNLYPSYGYDFASFKSDDFPIDKKVVVDYSSSSS